MLDGWVDVGRADQDGRVPNRRLEDEARPILARRSAGDRAAARRLHPAVVVVGVDQQRLADLLELGLALQGNGVLPHEAKRREEQRDENGDDADHDDQLDQAESGFLPRFCQNLRMIPGEGGKSCLNTHC